MLHAVSDTSLEDLGRPLDGLKCGSLHFVFLICNSTVVKLLDVAYVGVVCVCVYLCGA